MSAIVVSVPQRDWPAWRAGLGEVWEWKSSGKIPPVAAGDLVYVCAIDRVQGYGVAEELRLGGVKHSIFAGTGGRDVRYWSLFVRGFTSTTGWPMRPNSSWRHAA